MSGKQSESDKKSDSMKRPHTPPPSSDASDASLYDVKIQVSVLGIVCIIGIILFIDIINIIICIQALLHDLSWTLLIPASMPEKMHEKIWHAQGQSVDPMV